MGWWGKFPCPELMIRPRPFPFLSSPLGREWAAWRTLRTGHELRTNPQTAMEKRWTKLLIQNCLRIFHAKSHLEGCLRSDAHFLCKFHKRVDVLIGEKGRRRELIVNQTGSTGLSNSLIIRGILSGGLIRGILSFLNSYSMHPVSTSMQAKLPPVGFCIFLTVPGLMPLANLHVMVGSQFRFYCFVLFC